MWFFCINKSVISLYKFVLCFYSDMLYNTKTIEKYFAKIGILYVSDNASIIIGNFQSILF